MGVAEHTDRLGRFEIVRKIASGGMGTVSLACLSGEAGFRRLVALKRLHSHLADEPEFVNMFFDEARLAARIHHPNVVPILEIGKHGTERFLVMEYVEGATLEQLATKRGERVAPPLAVRIVLDALAGLQAAHDLEDDSGHPLELVHRDVSPQNILVGLDGLARLTDFGIARARSRVAKATTSGQFKGKLTYSAPEQVLARPMDRRTDVYAMGVVMWEALTGARLFDADIEAVVFDKLLHMPIPPPELVQPDLPRELGAVVLRALRRDPDQRFASAAEFAEALEDTAKRTGTLGTHREVAAFVTRISGERLHDRRDKVREWLTQRDVTATALPVPTSSVPSVAPTAVSPARVAAAPGPGAGSAPGMGAGSAPGTGKMGSAPGAGNAPAGAPRTAPGLGEPAQGPIAAAIGSSPSAPSMPYHWSVHGSIPPPPPPRRRAWPWIVGVAIVVALVVAAVPLLRHARPPATAASPPKADPPELPRAATPIPPPEPPAAPPTGVTSASSSARPVFPVRPSPAATRPTATGKNAEFGDRW
jgi:serine/threonine-protein kinase